jgi:hypothetical protein
MKNEKVTEEFSHFDNSDNIKTKHLFIEDNIIYSYGYHHPLCIKIHNETRTGFIYFLNTNGYSVTTSKHLGKLCRSLTNEKCNLKELTTEKKRNPLAYKHIILINDTEKLKAIIDFCKYKLNQPIQNTSIYDLALMQLEENQAQAL